MMSLNRSQYAVTSILMKSFKGNNSKMTINSCPTLSQTWRSVSNVSILNADDGPHDCKVLVVGGGSGGCALAAKLSTKLGPQAVTILEPADEHYYQPMFTLIGGGMKRLQDSCKTMASVLPKQATWIQDKAAVFDLKNNTVITAREKSIKYDVLIIATGLQLNYDKVPGLVEALSIPNGKVCSIYSPKYVDRTLECLNNTTDGNAVFTFPASPVKCPGAPQKIMYIAEHYFRKMNRRDNIQIKYFTALPVLFGVKHYADALWLVVNKRNINVNTSRNLIEVKPEQDIAIFENLEKPGEQIEEQYTMLHAVPPMSTPTEVQNCKELVNSTGFVDVNKSTMQHMKYSNVFAIGDSAGSPNSKTAASAAAQTPVVFGNIMAYLNGTDLKDTYDGYASCPLVTGYNTCILAEFDYSLTPLETFPMAQNKERYSMFLMKKYLMPNLYWNIMLKGQWNGPAQLRKLFSPLRY